MNSGITFEAEDFNSWRCSRWIIKDSSMEDMLTDTSKTYDMKMQRIALILTLINLVLATFLIAQLHPVSAQQGQSAPVLRGRSLEIVDNLGKVRAAIQIQPASTVNGKPYAENVILRIIDTKGKPLVKLGAGEDGNGGLYIDDGTDHGIQLITNKSGNFIRVTNADGKQQVIKP